MDFWCGSIERISWGSSVFSLRRIFSVSSSSLSSQSVSEPTRRRYQPLGTSSGLWTWCLGWDTPHGIFIFLLERVGHRKAFLAAHKVCKRLWISERRKSHPGAGGFDGLGASVLSKPGVESGPGDFGGLGWFGFWLKEKTHGVLFLLPLGCLGDLGTFFGYHGFPAQTQEIRASPNFSDLLKHDLWLRASYHEAHVKYCTFCSICQKQNMEARFRRWSLYTRREVQFRAAKLPFEPRKFGPWPLFNWHWSLQLLLLSTRRFYGWHAFLSALALMWTSSRPLLDGRVLAPACSSKVLPHGTPGSAAAVYARSHYPRQRFGSCVSLLGSAADVAPFWGRLVLDESFFASF